MTLIRRFRDIRSSVMEEILVLTHRHWWDKAIPYMEYDVYFLHVSNIWLLQNDKVDELMNEDNIFFEKFSSFEYQLNFKTTRYKYTCRLYGKFSRRNFTPFTNSKLNTMKDGYSLNKRTLLCTLCSICPTIYVNKYLISLTEEHLQREVSPS